MTQVRPAAVAGVFYPGDAQTLALTVTTLLQEADRPGSANSVALLPKAVIVPHAGYVYSGPVAATAYARLRAGRDRMKRVVLVGPCHRVPVRGIALPGVERFATPLGTVAVDQEAAALLRRYPQIVVSPEAHAWEHSLEVQLPFLQMVLGSFAIVPLAVGTASAEQVAEVLEALWGGPETLIVISSDLSHYLPYDVARQVDSATAHAIVSLQHGIDHEQACGAIPVDGLLLTAKRRGLEAQLLDLRNSGDTAGDKARVVGYGAFAFIETKRHVP
ncbi:AmmeMemoRadiSam system protein B [Pelomicrobium methylotrophicum]|uniref:MEMO1 family protein FR698_11345 n=1 Tax=Pelomicrobium methylotrophicum TaxID=2602750 RepID=A0A5C7EH21_9PROT|nr:AmmeMemoRadiSam system protein B [Pelomicrobium methylotrophicum]TXF11300.1 AmmeMemoRadiSam system protein B [Pelomicrobium methylotrophicum]